MPRNTTGANIPWIAEATATAGTGETEEAETPEINWNFNIEYTVHAVSVEQVDWIGRAIGNSTAEDWADAAPALGKKGD